MKFATNSLPSREFAFITSLSTFLFIIVFLSCNNKLGNQEIFISGKDTTIFTIPADSIGITIKEGADEGQLRRFLSEDGYSLARIIRKELFIIVSDKKKGLKRDEIFDEARNLKNRHKDMITGAGYLAYSKTATEPLVVTDELVIDFIDKTPGDQVTKFINDNGMEVAMQNPFIKTQYLVRLKDSKKGDALRISSKLSGTKILKYIHPNFIAIKDYRGIPDDPLFGDQWHHRNTGQAGGTVDADIDSDLAWDITQGIPGVVIAVIDNGFDMTHPDITPNFSFNTGEIAGNGTDDDGNGFIDDRVAWNFTGCSGLPCGNNTPATADHGTSTIGTAAARGNNGIGVSGSCPQCGVIPIETGATVFTDALSFGYAQSRGAKIISCSWGYTIGVPTTMAVETAINNAVAAGITVFFAMPNHNMPYCYSGELDIAGLPNVVGVGRSSNKDKFDLSGYGNCMDILAPSGYCGTVSSGTGTLWATTTDIQGVAGFNNTSTSPSCLCPTAEEADLSYTKCFNGTSFATPLTAGVAGLVLSVDNTMTPLQVQHLLQDCADKIEDSEGDYSLTTGYSNHSTHAFGRLNAFEAVRVAAPVANGGKGGVDIFLRDNRLDWGNTEQRSNVLFESVRGFIPHWESVDIKVDAPPFASAPTTSAQFDAFTDETPIGGMTSRVYVRVHNRGFRVAGSVSVKLHWVYAGLTFPPLPSDFWTSFPSDASDVSVWHPLGTRSISNLGYSGCSVAGGSDDASQVAVFDFPAPIPDPSLPNHYCLMALIDSPDDPLITPAINSTLNMDDVTPVTNNATHRNITIMTAGADRFREIFFMGNPTKVTIFTRIEVINPSKVSYKFEEPKVEQFITLKPGEKKLVHLQIDTKELKPGAIVRVQQLRRLNEDKTTGAKLSEVMGGITFRAVDKK